MLPSDYTFSAADKGTHTFTGLALFTAQAHVLTAQDTANGALTVTAAITVSAAPPSQFVIVAPASTVARSPFSITVTVFDPYGNLETNYTGTVTFTSSDPTPALLPFDYAYTLADKGTHNFGVVLFALGDQTLTVIDKGNGVIGSVTVKVTSPAPPPGGGPGGSRSPGGSLPALSAASDSQTVFLDWFFASLNDKTAELKHDRAIQSIRTEPSLGDCQLLPIQLTLLSLVSRGTESPEALLGQNRNARILRSACSDMRSAM